MMRQPVLNIKEALIELKDNLKEKDKALKALGKIQSLVSESAEFSDYEQMTAAMEILRSQLEQYQSTCVDKEPDFFKIVTFLHSCSLTAQK